MNAPISIELNASIEELSKVEQLIERLHEEGKLSEEYFGNVIVASTEAVLNAINHGSKMNPTKKVVYQLELENGELTITVIDSGEGFDYQNPPDPTDPANIEKGSGRGLFIMKNLADSLEFEENGSKVIMKFSLDTKVQQLA